jgi:hypothetical protein
MKPEQQAAQPAPTQAEYHSCGKHPGLRWAGAVMCPDCQSEFEDYVRRQHAQFDERIKRVREEFMQ